VLGSAFSGKRQSDGSFGIFSQLRQYDPTPLQERIDRIREILDKDPNSQPSWLGLGRGLIDLGRPAEAVEPLRHAVELQPDQAAAHRDLGRALLESGNPMEAAEIFARAIALAEKTGDIKTGREIHAFLRQAEKSLDRS
jgi:cytochrome c-type biogenesis protein CcmH/NrfG